MRITQDTLDKMIAHARRQAPRLAFGVLGGRDRDIRSCGECSNAARDPVVDALPDPDEMQANRKLLEADGLELRGIYYSEIGRGHAPSLPRPDRLLTWDLCCVVSLDDSEAPLVRAFAIMEDEVREVPIEVSNRLDLPAPEIQRLRGAFAENHFLGWMALLEIFETLLQSEDHPGCLAVLRELDDPSYALSGVETQRLSELRDIVLFRQGKLDALWAYYTAQSLNRQATREPSAEAGIRLRLGMIFQKSEKLAAARVHYQAGLALLEATGESTAAQHARQLLVVLDHQERTGKEHAYFQALWQPIVAGTVDVQREFGFVTTEALRQGPWRIALEAVAALERCGRLNELAQGLQSPSRVVRLATVASLKRIAAPQLESASRDASPMVRRQAALALGWKPEEARDLSDLTRSIRIGTRAGMAGFSGPDTGEFWGPAGWNPAAGAGAAFTVDEPEDGARMSFAEHLEELVRRVLVVLVVFDVAGLVSAVVLTDEWLYRPSSAFSTALLWTAPLLCAQTLIFAWPGLYRRERALSFVIAPLFFVLLGALCVGVGTWVCLPIDLVWLRWFTRFGHLPPPTAAVTAKAFVLLVWAVPVGFSVLYSWASWLTGALKWRTLFRSIPRFYGLIIVTVLLVALPTPIVTAMAWFVAIDLLPIVSVANWYIRSTDRIAFDAALTGRMERMSRVVERMGRAVLEALR